MSRLIELMNEYISKTPFGIYGALLEVFVSFVLIFIMVCIVVKKTHQKYLFIFAFLTYLLCIAAVVFKLQILVISMLLFIPIFVIIQVSIPIFEAKANRKKNTQQISKTVVDVYSKEELIDTLVKTVEYLSQRKIGSIITIEKQNSLNAFAQKAIKLDAEVSFELLETIFHPNTALHDGAVIIRGNKVLCASAFYHPSERVDIPNHYGSRHRAALGISEESDAFTLVVSEETGAISTTIDGTITSNLSGDALKQSLNQHIVAEGE